MLGVLHWLGNKIAGKLAGGKGKNEVNEIRIEELTGAEIENTYGASINPDYKPMQENHFITNKSQKYTPGFEDIINKYGLKLDDAWNKQLMPHQGRHPYAYHEHIMEKLTAIDELAQGNKEIFLQEFENLKKTVVENPDMLYKKYWEGLAKKWKKQVDILK